MKTIDENDATTQTRDKERLKTGRRIKTILAVGAILFLLLIAYGMWDAAQRVDGQAKVIKTKADLAALRGALDQFRLDCGRYPTAKEGFAALRKQPVGLKSWKGPYLSNSIPTDPWANAYVYITPGPNGRDGYMVESYGADGRPGGEGDDADIIDGSD